MVRLRAESTQGDSMMNFIFGFIAGLGVAMLAIRYLYLLMDEHL